jgi:hypothetical protein
VSITLNRVRNRRAEPIAGEIQSQVGRSERKNRAAKSRKSQKGIKIGKHGQGLIVMHKIKMLFIDL